MPRPGRGKRQVQLAGRLRALDDLASGKLVPSLPGPDKPLPRGSDQPNGRM